MIYPIRSVEEYDLSPIVIKNTNGMRLKKAKSNTDRVVRESNKEKFYDSFAKVKHKK